MEFENKRGQKFENLPKLAAEAFFYLVLFPRKKSVGGSQAFLLFFFSRFSSPSLYSTDLRYTFLNKLRVACED